MEQGSQPVGDMDDVFQDDPDRVLLPTVPVTVTVDGPVQTHDLPSVSSGMRSYDLLADDVARKVSGHDPRRRVARLVSDQVMTVGIDMNSVETGYSARWPANVVLEVTHVEEIWVKLAADGWVSVVTENWAS